MRPAAPATAGAPWLACSHPRPSPSPALSSPPTTPQPLDDIHSEMVFMVVLARL